MITSRLQVTLELTLGAMLVALAVGVPLGILSARRENTRLDHAVRVIESLQPVDPGLLAGAPC